MTSTLEAAFARALALLAPQLPAPVREYRFHPTRRWRFDFAWPAQRVAVEIEGGAWSQGRHTRGAGFGADCAKYNMATLAGWRILRFTGDMLRDPAQCVTQVVTLLEA